VSRIGLISKLQARDRPGSLRYIMMEPSGKELSYNLTTFVAGMSLVFRHNPRYRELSATNTSFRDGSEDAVSPVTRLIAYSGDPMALSFYTCECGMYFRAVQEHSINGSTCRCDCGRTVRFHGQVTSLWKTRRLDSLFGTGWTDVPLADSPDEHSGSPAERTFR
jgi:hypothetical protein